MTLIELETHEAELMVDTDGHGASVDALGADDSSSYLFRAVRMIKPQRRNMHSVDYA